MLNGLDLFSGIGGLTIALSEWVRPVAYCEIDRYAQGVLLSRMAEGKIPCAPIWNDVSTFPGIKYHGKIDIIFGGFPCQDISVAGRGAGLEGKRSGLFFEIMRLVDEIRPRFIFLENVPAITFRGLGTVAAEITQRGYDSRWCILSAAEVGAQHLRRRWFLLAYNTGKRAKGNGHKSGCGREDGSPGQTDRCSHKSNEGNWEACADKLLRDTYWVSSGVDRIKCLGNAVVPLQAKEAFKRLMGLDHVNKISDDE